MSTKKSNEPLPPIFPAMEDWPIYKLSEDRTNFVEEIEHHTLNRLMEMPASKVSDIISKTIYKERIRIKEEPWKVDPPKEKSFWKNISKKHAEQALDTTSQEQIVDSNRELLKKIIHNYAEEIVGTFRIKTFLFARRFLYFFFTRLLNAAALKSFRGLWGKSLRLQDKLVAVGEVEAIRELMKKGTVVLVPTHFSNLDSIMIGYAMDAFVGLPSFSYGAGLNLYNSGYTAYFMNRLGAYRIDRRKKNSVYLETLKSMSMLSIKRGVNSLFFPGGTRSRSGHLESKLKLGLLGTAVEAQRYIYQENRDEKVFIIPLILGYHFVLEAEFLIEQHLREKGKEHYIMARDDSHSPFQLFKFAWRLLSQGNDITLSFGQPMDVLGNPVHKDGQSYSQNRKKVEVKEYFMNSNGEINADLQREAEYTSYLGDKVAERFMKDNVVLSSHLVAFAAFKMVEYQNPSLDLYGILRLPAEDYLFPRDVLKKVIEMIKEQLIILEVNSKIKLSTEIHDNTETLLKDGIKHLGNFHVKSPLRFDKKERIISDSFKILFYYHNRLDNYDLESYINWTELERKTILLDGVHWQQEMQKN